MSAPVEPELLCPHCGYNLRGLPEDRCPECGRPFDRARLLELTDPKPRAPADEAGRRLGPWHIAVLAALEPRRLAHLLPPWPAAEHGLACAVVYDLAILTSLVGFPAAIALLSGVSRGDLLVVCCGFGLPLGVILMFGGWLCETVTAVLLTCVVRPTGVATRYPFWRATTRYTRGFLILTALWTLPTFYGHVLRHGKSLESPYCCFGFELIIFGWWATALGEMIRARAVPGWRAWLGCTIVPVVGGFAIYWAGWLIWTFRPRAIF